jgi:hypothetical protein
LGRAPEPAREPIEPDEPVEAAGRQLELGPAVVEEPAQAVLDPRALRDQVLAMVEQQLDLACRARELSRRQGLDAFLQCGARDRQRVDRVRLAALPRRAAAPRHQLRRHAHDPLAACEQEA